MWAHKQNGRFYVAELSPHVNKYGNLSIFSQIFAVTIIQVLSVQREQSREQSLF